MTEIRTIGHSTRTAEELVELLRAHGVSLLVDIRTVPRSRRNPQFNKETLPDTLDRHGIAYRHEKRLGGLRKPRKDSINTAWRNASFRGYADHMQTDEFVVAVQDLVDLASEQPLALMCAESVPWRCHRSLVADALTARGVEVRHIMNAKTASPHRTTPFARIDGENVTYPGLSDA
jgi:uncharacterized protein (DUF488 family)